MLVPWTEFLPEWMLREGLEEGPLLLASDLGGRGGGSLVHVRILDDVPPVGERLLLVLDQADPLAEGRISNNIRLGEQS